MCSFRTSLVSVNKPTALLVTNIRVNILAKGQRERIAPEGLQRQATQIIQLRKYNGGYVTSGVGDRSVIQSAFGIIVNDSHL